MQRFDDNRLKRLHVIRHHVHQNQRRGTNLPVLEMKIGDTKYEGHRARIEGPSELIYEPAHPLPSGALVWIETRAPVEFE